MSAGVPRGFGYCPEDRGEAVPGQLERRGHCAREIILRGAGTVRFGNQLPPSGDAGPDRMRSGWV